MFNKRIAIIGKAGSGKDTVVEMIKEIENREDIIVTSFAEPIYEIAKSVFGMTYKDRELLQDIGSKMKEIDEDVWINCMKERLNQKPDDYIIVSDVRFCNEFEALVEKGFFFIYLDVDEDTRFERIAIRDDIEITEQYKGRMRKHPSETAFQMKVPNVSPRYISAYSPTIFGSWDKLDSYSYISSLEKLYTTANSVSGLTDPVTKEYLNCIKYKYPNNIPIQKSEVSRGLMRYGLLKQRKSKTENMGFNVDNDISAIKTKDLNIKLYDRNSLIGVMEDISEEDFFQILENYEYRNEKPKDSLPLTIAKEGIGNCSGITYFVLEWLNSHYPQTIYDYKITTAKISNEEDHVNLVIENNGTIQPIDLVNSKQSSIEALRNMEFKRKGD